MANILNPIGGGNDDSPQIQAAMNALIDPDDKWPNEAGGKIILSKGKYSIKTPLVVPCGGITLQGEGNIATIACTLWWMGEGPMITIRNPENKYESGMGFRMADIQLRGARKGTAIFFADFESYGSRFIFDRVAAHYFAKVFEVQAGKSYPGAFHCNDCYFTWNNQIMDATARPINEVRFRDCNLHQNGRDPENYPDTQDKYALDIRRGSNIMIMDCILEGQPRVIKAVKVHGLTIEGGRFEGNNRSDDPVVLVENCRDVFIKRCYHRILSAEETNTAPTLLIKNCENYDFAGSHLRKIVVEHKWIPV